MKEYSPLVVLILILFAFLPGITNADTGPQPSVYFDVSYNDKRISESTFSAVMLSCEPKDDSQKENDLKYIYRWGPQFRIYDYDSVKDCYWSPVRDLKCKNGSCRIGCCGGIPSDFKLAAYIPSINKVFVTNNISRTNFFSRYRAELFLDGAAKISETTPIFLSDKFISFLKAFLITITLELLVSVIYISTKSLSNKLLAFVLLTNIISLPIVWFIFPSIKLPFTAIVIISEMFALVFEFCFVYLLAKQFISFKQSILLSLVNNLVSFLIGGIIYRILWVLII